LKFFLSPWDEGNLTTIVGALIWFRLWRLGRLENHALLIWKRRIWTTLTFKSVREQIVRGKKLRMCVSCIVTKGCVYAQGGRSQSRYERYPSTVLRLEPLDGIEEEETLRKCGDSLLGGLGQRWALKFQRTRRSGPIRNRYVKREMIFWHPIFSNF